MEKMKKSKIYIRLYKGIELVCDIPLEEQLTKHNRRLEIIDNYLKETFKGQYDFFNRWTEYTILHATNESNKITRNGDLLDEK